MENNVCPSKNDFRNQREKNWSIEEEKLLMKEYFFSHNDYDYFFQFRN